MPFTVSVPRTSNNVCVHHSIKERKKQKKKKETKTSDELKIESLKYLEIRFLLMSCIHFCVWQPNSDQSVKLSSTDLIWAILNIITLLQSLFLTLSVGGAE